MKCSVCAKLLSAARILRCDVCDRPNCGRQIFATLESGCCSIGDDILTCSHCLERSEKPVRYFDDASDGDWDTPIDYGDVVLTEGDYNRRRIFSLSEIDTERE